SRRALEQKPFAMAALQRILQRRLEFLRRFGGTFDPNEKVIVCRMAVRPTAASLWVRIPIKSRSPCPHVVTVGSTKCLWYVVTAATIGIVRLPQSRADDGTDRQNLAGTSHVSLPTDIIQLFGTSVAVGSTVLGVFELGERLASQRAKDALSKWLLTFDVQKAKALPDGTQELFERIFGERHFSVKCFVRSVAFSLGAMAFIIMLGLLIRPRDFVQLLTTIHKPGLLLFGDWLLVANGYHGVFC